MAYDRAQQKLWVEMKNGWVHEFQQVPSNFWIELAVAPSIGKYFYDNIKESFPNKKWMKAREEEE